MPVLSMLPVKPGLPGHSQGYRMSGADRGRAQEPRNTTRSPNKTNAFMDIFSSKCPIYTKVGGLSIPSSFGLIFLTSGIMIGAENRGDRMNEEGGDEA